MKVATLNNRFSLETKQQLLLEEDTIKDFHSYRGEINVWLQIFSGPADSLVRGWCNWWLEVKANLPFTNSSFTILKCWALKNYVISTLSVLYKWTNKAWVIAHLFMTWFTKNLKPEKKIPLKVLLFIDKVTGHQRTLMKMYNEINYVFLPANTTAILQLMNQGVILTFKLFEK